LSGFKASTAILWLAPAILLAIGALVFWTVVKRRRLNAPAPQEDPRRRAQIEALLEPTSSKSRD